MFPFRPRDALCSLAYIAYAQMFPMAPMLCHFSHAADGLRSVGVSPEFVFHSSSTRAGKGPTSILGGKRTRRSLFPSRVQQPNEMTETPEQRAQNAKFGYKAPESVYKKHDPKASMIGKGTFGSRIGCAIYHLRWCWLASPAASANSE